MIKSKLMKAFMLGVGMAAFTTNIAFAQMSVPVVAPAQRGEVLSDDQIALFAKQKDIDQYLFTDHADEIKAKGFTVTYTGVAGDVVEIGITPFTQDNADYLYGLFGKDGVSVVEAADNVIYANSTGTAEAGVDYAEPGVVVGTAIDGSATTLPDGAVSLAGGSGSSAGSTDGAAGETKAVGAPDAAESTAVGAGDVQTEPDQIYTTTAIQETPLDAKGALPQADTAAASQTGTDIRTVAAAESQTAVPNTERKDSGAVDTSLIVLAIAGGAVVIGGGILAAKKKK